MLINELISAVFQLLLFTLIPFIVWVIYYRKENFFKWLGFRKFRFQDKPVKVFIMTAVAVIIYCISTFIVINNLSSKITLSGSQFNGMGISAVPACLIYGYIQTGLSEEIIFRGFILKRIAQRFGFKTGNFIQGLVFGLMHGVPFGLISGNILITVVMTVLPGLFGMFEGWLNEKKCEGSIIPSWLLHGTMNFIIACIGL